MTRGKKSDLQPKSIVLYLRFSDDGKPPWISSSTKAGRFAGRFAWENFTSGRRRSPISSSMLIKGPYGWVVSFSVTSKTNKHTQKQNCRNEILFFTFNIDWVLYILNIGGLKKTPRLSSCWRLSHAENNSYCSNKEYEEAVMSASHISRHFLCLFVLPKSG